jgi:hypothetical protein
MNTPLNALTAAALAALLGGTAWSIPTPAANAYNQGTTADGKTIVAAGTYGPFQGPTCEAGTPGCTAAGAELASAEDSLASSGDGQTKAVQQMEKEMLDNGTYKSRVITPDGKGAVITMPDGSMFYSDYVHGFDTIPTSPESFAKDTRIPQAARDAAAKGSTPAPDPSKAAAAHAEANMFTGGAGGGVSINSVNPTPAGRSFGGAPSSDGAAGDDSTGDTASSDNGGSVPNDNGGAVTTDNGGGTDLNGMGRVVGSGFNGSNGSGGPNGSGGSYAASSGGNAARESAAMSAMTAAAVASAGNGKEAAASYTYTRLADCASGQNCPTLNTLRQTRAQVTARAGAGAGADTTECETNRGTSFFGR